MSKYAAPHRATSKRSLSRRARIVLLASLLVPVSLLTIANLPASAAAKYATIQDVQDAISAALAPIQSAIASLQNTQTTHTLQITDLQTQQTNQAQQINNLQNSTAKSIKVYDANDQELGIAASSGIFIPTLNRFIYFWFNSNALAGSYQDQGFIYFTATDCTGTAYVVPSDANPPASTSNVITEDGQHFYIYPDLAPATQIIVNSEYRWDYNNSQPQCIPHPIDNQPHKAYALQQVTLPFSTPVAWPLQFKYQ